MGEGGEWEREGCRSVRGVGVGGKWEWERSHYGTTV